VVWPDPPLSSDSGQPHPGLLVARTASGTTSYLHQDPLGSVRATSDGNGNWAYVTAYKPFGQEYATSGPYASLKYTGQWRDTNTGLYYLYRRFYDPDLGRFLSPDPILGHITVPQSLDRYVYTVNNPLRYVDPTGEDSHHVNGTSSSARGRQQTPNRIRYTPHRYQASLRDGREVPIV
jgi:RHS repeat-associated protein